MKYHEITAKQGKVEEAEDFENISSQVNLSLVAVLKRPATSKEYKLAWAFFGFGSWAQAQFQKGEKKRNDGSRQRGVDYGVGIRY